MHIEITNLDLNLIEADLQRLFTPYGEINTIQIVRDHWNNRSKGRAVVDMPVEKEAQQAVLSLNGAQLGTKKITVTATSHHDEDPKRNFIA